MTQAKFGFTPNCSIGRMPGTQLSDWVLSQPTNSCPLPDLNRPAQPWRFSRRWVPPCAPHWWVSRDLRSHWLIFHSAGYPSRAAPPIAGCMNPLSRVESTAFPAFPTSQEEEMPGSSFLHKTPPPPPPIPRSRSFKPFPSQSLEVPAPLLISENRSGTLRSLESWHSSSLFLPPKT